MKIAISQSVRVTKRRLRAYPANFSDGFSVVWAIAEVREAFSRDCRIRMELPKLLKAGSAKINRRYGDKVMVFPCLGFAIAELRD